MKRYLVGAVVLVVLAGPFAFGAGMLIPSDKEVPPLAIKYQRVDIRIKDGVASATMEQVFKNSVDRDLEATYVFPLPENASISDFAMYINGKRTSGELVEKDKARSIYEDIVRRMKDPGLLEYMGGNLFRVRVYPVPKNGEQRIELTYSQPLEFESGLYKFVYPLKTGEKSSGTLEDFTIRAKLSSAVPIKNVYSPSHKVGISRKGENEATIGFEENKSVLDRDFVLYYGVSKKDFGLNLLTHAVKDQDGFFMTMISPTVNPPKGEIIQRDIAFVLDTSGSMLGEKIKQAQEALKYCVNKLNDGDRFNIVRFSTDVEPWSDKLVPATEANRKKAGEFIEKLEARGGTDINSALKTALETPHDDARPFTVVFLTDGQPTLGVTDTPDILDNVRKAAAAKIRIFAFGVGENVNTHLLDRLSGENGGLSQYVEPREDIEVKVSSFYDKISLPVLAQPKITVEKLKVTQVHPQTIPDLFAGGQITILGRYEGNGDFAIKLTGEINGKPAEFVYEGTFPKENSENDFIPRIWATRRVGYLLDEIRLKGENNELKDEVLRLSKEYGIMTPYTSYLVLEDEKRPAASTSATVGGGGPIPPPPRMPEPERLWARSGRAKEQVAAKAVPVFGAPAESAALGDGRIIGGGAADAAALNQYMGGKSGEVAIELSRTIQSYRGRESAAEETAVRIRHVGGKIFYLVNGVWTDRDYKKDMKTTRVKYASEEYFKWLEKKPALKQYLALGEKVIVCLDADSALVVEAE